MSVKERLKEYLDRKGIKHRDFTDSIGASQGYINSIRKSISMDKIPLIKKHYPDLDIDWLLFGNEGNAIQKDVVFKDVIPKVYPTHLEVRLVTVKARAGYTDSYYAEEFLNDLPVVLVEADKEYKGKYLAFEVDGDSMETEYFPGDIVICREVKRDLWQYKLHYKDYDFVIAHGTKGIMLKEIIDHNVETGDIVCHSLNEKYKDFTLNLKEVSFLYNVVEHRRSGKNKRRYR
ncbi:LexA family transcriptional regulator [Chryseobacterium sp. SG20098]|uniref:LexA family transcriptional regulator n=1 Tax=Chryseobacterium sp. SG20098 TaxID=3074145 RepID=UPI0028832A7F|nr:LexA family transcriptional regulator [Chryseobacterium sp. SG20098]WNI34665.1 LexA family transcriptional regulator [Chryseobacterium sp. SG20098]